MSDAASALKIMLAIKAKPKYTGPQLRAFAWFPATEVGGQTLGECLPPSAVYRCTMGISVRTNLALLARVAAMYSVTALQSPASPRNSALSRKGLSPMIEPSLRPASEIRAEIERLREASKGAPKGRRLLLCDWADALTWALGGRAGMSPIIPASPAVKAKGE